MAVFLTTSPVTQTAEQEVNSASRKETGACPSVESGRLRRTAPRKMSRLKLTVMIWKGDSFL